MGYTKINILNVIIMTYKNVFPLRDEKDLQLQ